MVKTIPFFIYLHAKINGLDRRFFSLPMLKPEMEKLDNDHL